MAASPGDALECSINGANLLDDAHFEHGVATERDPSFNPCRGTMDILSFSLGLGSH
jgi:hypothetical protein